MKYKTSQKISDRLTYMIGLFVISYTFIPGYDLSKVWKSSLSVFIGQEKSVPRKKENGLDCDPFEGLFFVSWFRIE